MNNERILSMILNYATLRVDLINISNSEKNTIEIIENSDANSNVSFPKWFRKGGKSQGAVVTSSNLSLNLKIKCPCDGNLEIKLRSVDTKDKTGERFPIYVDVNEFRVNKETVLRNHNLISFSSPRGVSKKVKKGEIVNIYLKWMPFNNQCEYKNPVNPLKMQIKSLSEDLEFLKSNNNPALDSLKLKKYHNQLSNLENEFNEYKKTTNKYLDTLHFLLDDLYINHEQKPIGFLNRLHEVNVELLIFFKNICKKYDLEWWLDYGNLIGAVRHGGSVPWDDDTDVGMMRKEYMKLCEILPDEVKKYNLDNIVELYYRERIVNYGRADSFLQIKFYSNPDLTSRNLLLANIDVFPYDYINSYNAKNLDELYYNTKIDYFENLIQKKNPEECLNIMYEKLNLNFNKTDLIIPGVEGACGPKNTYDLSVFDANKIFPLSEIEYSNVLLPCPNDVDYYLRKIYGDYLSLPKNLRRHNRTQSFRKIKNNHIYYLDLLENIKEINENF
jgi:phosphorylcholine metabolism protein LicD